MNTPIHIVIDARWIFTEISGIGNYTRQLVEHLSLIDHFNTYTILFNDANIQQRTIKETNFTQNPNFRPYLFPYSVFSPISQLFLPYHLKAMKCDIYHSTNYMIPLMAFSTTRKKPYCVVTIHDVIPLIFHKAAPKSKKARLFLLYRFLMFQIVKKATIIVTDSNASKEDIIRILHPATPEKIRTVYCGSPPTFFACERKIIQNFNEQRPARLLYVGRMDPYKNVIGLIRIFNKTRQICNFPLQLIIAGSIDPRYPEAIELVKKLGLTSCIKWTGYLSDHELHQLYLESDLLVHPSKYEGFGLQIVEAMSSGLPVICSNTSSLPEVAGNAAVMHNPDDEDTFAHLIKDILSDYTKRETMRKNGLERAKLFTWAKTAENIKNIYMELQKIDNH